MDAGLAGFTEYTIGYARRIHAVRDGMAFERAATLPVALRMPIDSVYRIEEASAVLERMAQKQALRKDRPDERVELVHERTLGLQDHEQ